MDGYLVSPDAAATTVEWGRLLTDGRYAYFPTGPDEDRTPQYRWSDVVEIAAFGSDEVTYVAGGPA